MTLVGGLPHDDHGHGGDRHDHDHGAGGFLPSTHFDSM